MIFPFLQGFPGFDKAPLTWVIVLLNVIIFMMTFGPQVRQETKINEVFQNEEFISTQGHAYSKYVTGSDKGTRAIASVSENDSEVFVAVQSIRDSYFLKNASQLKFEGDQVAIDEWQKGLVKFNEEELKRPARIFGLSEGKLNWKNWITYQFMHGGLIHLISNMLILLIFGGVLEARMGSSKFLTVYLLSGFFGALFFVWATGVYGSPLIGASGAIFGLIGCYVASEAKKRVRFFYFASPLQGYWGFVYLPTLFVASVCIIPELASFFSTPEGMGGVAYAAHIGGASFGILAGLVYRLIEAKQAS